MKHTLASKDRAAAPRPVTPAQAGLILVHPADPLPYGTPIPDVYEIKPGFANPKPGLTSGNPRSIGTR